MHKFFENTIQSKYIKALLQNSYIPNIETLSRNDMAIEGRRYILKRRVYECTKTGFYLNGDSDTEADFKYISEFDFGRYYPKVTRNYISNTDYYDSDTHERLYSLLRIYKDILGINLLPFYNIYSNKYATNINIIKDESGRGSVYQKNYKDVKLLKIKIRFNRTYTLALDCNSEVWTAPVFLNRDNLFTIFDDAGNEIDITDKFIDERDYITRYNNLNFSQPITFRIESTNNEFVKYESYLYLVIKLPLTNQSSVTVLEGDYTNISKKPIINMEYINSEIDNENLNDVLISNLSLLQMNTGTSYPYSNRLVEYLLFNPITQYDPLTGNITRVQESSYGINGSSITKGSWNNYLRAKLFSLCNNAASVRWIDLNGYVDRDIENYLNKSGVN